MAKYRIRADQIGVAFPKKKRIKKHKRASNPESELQHVVNIKLEGMGLPYLRIPDSLLRVMFSDRFHIPNHIRAEVSESIGGLPDNMVIQGFEHNDFYFWLVCPIELKTEIGKLTPRQKERMRETPFNIIKTQKDFDKLITIFQDYHKELQ